MKKIEIFKLILFLILLGILFTLKKYYWPSTTKIVLDSAVQLEFRGKIDSIYRDKANHNDTYAILSSGYVYGVYADWEKKFEIGDSVSKKKGSTIVKLFKKDGSKESLDYNKLVERWKD